MSEQSSKQEPFCLQADLLRVTAENGIVEVYQTSAINGVQAVIIYAEQVDMLVEWLQQAKAHVQRLADGGR